MKPLKRKVVLFVVGFFMLGIITFFCIYRVQVQKMNELVNREVIYEGIYIDEFDVGGLTKEQALNLLSTRDENLYETQKIRIKVNEVAQYELTYNAFGFQRNSVQMVNQAYLFAKSGSLRERYNWIKNLENTQEHYYTSESYDLNKVNEWIMSIQSEWYQEAKDATFARKNGQFEITEEIVGVKVDVEESEKNIHNALKMNETEASLCLKERAPEFTKEFYAVIDHLIGSFSTQFNITQTNRNKNIQIASGKINGTLLLPGNEFSTHETIGPVETENGYVDAPIIVGGKLEPGVGGGVCQIATTLYNAVLVAELEVVERRNHSLPVAYVEMGRDATISGEAIDFQFKNNMEFPIYIESYVIDNWVYMDIYGKETRITERKIDFETEIISTTNPPEAEIIVDETLAPFEEVVEKKATIGYTVKLYKLIYMNNEVVDRILINKSTYQPSGAIIRVGAPAKAQDTISN